MKKWDFQKVWYEKMFFEKTECLIKTVKKFFFEKTKCLASIYKSRVWVINYQKGQYIYIYIYKEFFVLIISLNASYWHNIFTKSSQ